MKNKNYRVLRDDIFVGRVVTTERVRPIYEFEDDATKEKPIKDDSYLTTNSYYPYRTILFTLDEMKKANDLLYDSPHYPVLNITDNQYFKEHNNETIVLIDEFISLAQLLKHFNYGIVLQYEDIIEIKERFFSGDYAKDNCELFGYREVNRLKELALRDKRQFAYEKKTSLSPEYFIMINKLENNKLIDIINGEQTKINSFKPSISESKVRRLKKKEINSIR